MEANKPKEGIGGTAMGTKAALKKLGVLGGMGPAASTDFLRILAERAPAKTDQEHPIVYLISDSQIPDRTCAIFGRGSDPSEQIKADLLSLAAMGAELLAVPCNTAHLFIDRFREELPVPLVHIVEETVLAGQKLNPAGCWMLSTTGTRQCGLYQHYAEKYDYSLFLPEPDIALRVQECIELVKAGRKEEAGRRLTEIVLALWQEKDLPIMAACTELPLAYDASGLPPERTVSSLAALANGCLDRIYN